MLHLYCKAQFLTLRKLIAPLIIYVKSCRMSNVQQSIIEMFLEHNYVKFIYNFTHFKVALTEKA